MADSFTGSRSEDANGLSLMLGDSHHAQNTFGMTGSKFTNVPKNKFLFFVKFIRPVSNGGSDWSKDISFAVKTLDRPRISFKSQTLNQYNRKRVIQTGHDFEALQLRFHDTVDPALRRLFVEYYQFYYADSKTYGNGANTVYDIVMPEQYEQGNWGFLPPLADQDYGYFFSHIEVYQLYQGLYEKFTLINPKITMYNPDDLDYAGAASAEIQVTVEYEGITFSEPDQLTPDMAADFGLDRGLYWNVENELPEGVNPGLSLNPNEDRGSFGDTVFNSLRRNISSIADGDFSGVISEVANAYDANRGLAVGLTGVKGIKNLVNGNLTEAKQGIKTLVKGIKGFNKPGGLF
jgi:hypothetical protein